MDQLKLYLISLSAIRGIDYNVMEREIILVVDISLVGWGLYLIQVVNNRRRRHIVCYNNKVWSTVKRDYNAGKCEACDLLLSLKKIWHYLYRVSFVIEFDIYIFIVQFNRSATNVLGVVLNR